MRRLFAIFAILAPLLSAPPALAVNPDEMLADPVLEARARKISSGLRCLVCQNQSIDDSNADLARDLRILVRERLSSGDTDQEVVDYIVDRYGEFVLLKPRFAAHTLALWLAPPLILALGGVAVFFAYRRRRSATGEETAPLDAEEEKRLAEILSQER